MVNHEDYCFCTLTRLSNLASDEFLTELNFVDIKRCGIILVVICGKYAHFT